jgi:ubiquinone/menaquinone biosynthesis C-methylase UbiE
MSGSRSTFASWGPWYDDSNLQSLLFEPAHAAVLRKLDQRAPHAMRLLDVGCGTGRLLKAAASRCPLVVGADPCPEMLDVARHRCLSTGASLVCAVAERLPFASRSFDVVTSTLSLRHWEDPTRGLGELTRVLSATGLLVIAEAEIDETPAPSRHRWRLRRPEGPLRLLVTQSGLVVIDEQPIEVHGPVFNVHLLTARQPAMAPATPLVCKR